MITITPGVARMAGISHADAANAYTAKQIEFIFGIAPNTLRQWAYRGHVRRIARDLYDGRSVIARWRAVADRNGSV